MRISIRNHYSWNLVVSVQRTSADTPEEAQSVVGALSRELEPLLVGRAEIVPPRPPRARSKRPVSAMITIRPPAREESYTMLDYQGDMRTFKRRISLPESIDERAELIALLEDVSCQYMERVDALGAVGWCLKPLEEIGRTINPTEKNPLSNEQREIVEAQEAKYIDERAQLLAPYLAGKHPIVLPDIFAAFYSELSLAEQRLIHRMVDGRDGINATSLTNHSSGKLMRGLTYGERKAQWTLISDHLLRTQWAVVGTSQRLHMKNSYDAPILVRGKKSNLLPLAQMVVN